MVQHWLRNFARPDYTYDRSNSVGLQADKTIREVTEHQKALELRLRLLDIQGSPRGTLNG